MNKIGFGYDIHLLKAGRKLILGGVEIPFPLGLAGHSDGDCLIHAIIDALLGALGEGDIGVLFPDTDPEFKDVPSVALLEGVRRRVLEGGWDIVNIDTVIVAEEPKLAPFMDAIKARLGPAVGLKKGALGVKAKTNERLGDIGQGRAIACWAVALLEKPSSS